MKVEILVFSFEKENRSRKGFRIWEKPKEK